MNTRKASHNLEDKACCIHVQCHPYFLGKYICDPLRNEKLHVDDRYRLLQRAAQVSAFFLSSAQVAQSEETNVVKIFSGIPNALATVESACILTVITQNQV